MQYNLHEFTQHIRGFKIEAELPTCNVSFHFWFNTRTSFVDANSFQPSTRKRMADGITL